MGTGRWTDFAEGALLDGRRLMEGVEARDTLYVAWCVFEASRTKSGGRASPGFVARMAVLLVRLCMETSRKVVVSKEEWKKECTRMDRSQKDIRIGGKSPLEGSHPSFLQCPAWRPFVFSYQDSSLVVRRCLTNDSLH